MKWCCCDEKKKLVEGIIGTSQSMDCGMDEERSKIGKSQQERQEGVRRWEEVEVCSGRAVLEVVEGGVVVKVVELGVVIVDGEGLIGRE